ncbi:MAG: hypothetical protein WC119_00465 [Synergistaceae bacterium]
MKTEITSEEMVKATRKKVFWRLYGLPWIICVFILASTCIGCLFYVRDLQIRFDRKDSFREKVLLASKKGGEVLRTELESELINRGIILGVERIRREIVDRGYGYWDVNDNTLDIEFKWYDIKQTSISESTNIIYSRNVRDVGKREREEREYPFTWDNYKFSQEIGLDFENQLIGTVRLTIDHLFKTRGIKDARNDIEFSIHVKNEVEESIRKRFDGFETYNRTN